MARCRPGCKDHARRMEIAQSREMNLAILRSRELKAYSEAVERIHAASDTKDFSQSVFSALAELIPASFITSDAYHLASGISRHASSRQGPRGWAERLSELVEKEHPAYFAIRDGLREPLRLDDLISQRRLRRLALYHDVFRPLNGGHQIVLPLVAPGFVAGFTINRDTPFTEEEMCLARLLGPHLALAHLHSRSEMEACRGFPDERTVTPREREVLHWIGQGKRDAEIALILGIARRTVSKHVEHILAKLGCETRTAALSALNEHRREV